MHREKECHNLDYMQFILFIKRKNLLFVLWVANSNRVGVNICAVDANFSTVGAVVNTVCNMVRTVGSMTSQVNIISNDKAITIRNNIQTLLILLSLHLIIIISSAMFDTPMVRLV